jgi:hypothetical protein
MTAGVSTKRLADDFYVCAVLQASDSNFVVTCRCVGGGVEGLGEASIQRPLTRAHWSGTHDCLSERAIPFSRTPLFVRFLIFTWLSDWLDGWKGGKIAFEIFDQDPCAAPSFDHPKSAVPNVLIERRPARPTTLHSVGNRQSKFFHI